MKKYLSPNWEQIQDLFKFQIQPVQKCMAETVQVLIGEKQKQHRQCLKIAQKLSYVKKASEASYVYII